MKHVSTLLFALLFSGAILPAQNCTSPVSNYDLIVVTTITVPPQTSSPYMQGYVCNGGVLYDSAYCCTRFANIDSGGVMYAGPNSYGTIYIRNGGTFNGQNVSGGWTVFSEPNATVINHPGTIVACPVITFPNVNCIMGFEQPVAELPTVALNGNQLNFGFSSAKNDLRIELYDITGKLAAGGHTVQSSVYSIDVSTLPEAVYAYRIFSGEELIGSGSQVIVR